MLKEVLQGIKENDNRRNSDLYKEKHRKWFTIFICVSQYKKHLSHLLITLKNNWLLKAKKKKNVGFLTYLALYAWQEQYKGQEGKWKYAVIRFLHHVWYVMI